MFDNWIGERERLRIMTITLPTLTALARSQEGIDLSGEDGDAYTPAIEDAETAIADLRNYIADIKALKSHAHDWSRDTGYCYTCGADGNA